MPSPELLLSINELDRQLKDAERRLPSSGAVRRQLSGQGVFRQLGAVNVDDLKSWLRGGVLAACDGSRVEYGPFYPHTLVLQKAIAITSHSQETISDVSCFTPLLPATAQEIEELARQKGTAVADAYPRWLQRRLAALEVAVAIKAIQSWKPRLMLMDGGLLLFDTLPGWDELLAAAREADTLLVGVIEEIATAELAPRLGLSRPTYDRELLYGLLHPGEVFLLAADQGIKKDYRTAFTRFSTGPAAAACDFLPGASDDDIFSCLQLLYATTGSTGRGVPFLLDLVDRKVRLTRQEGEVLLKMGLSPAVYEKYFVAQRQRRNI